MAQLGENEERVMEFSTGQSIKNWFKKHRVDTTVRVIRRVSGNYADVTLKEEFSVEAINFAHNLTDKFKHITSPNKLRLYLSHWAIFATMVEENQFSILAGKHKVAGGGTNNENVVDSEKVKSEVKNRAFEDSDKQVKVLKLGNESNEESIKTCKGTVERALNPRTGIYVEINGSQKSEITPFAHTILKWVLRLDRSIMFWNKNRR